MKLFSDSQPWWRGNLHCHTTVSDGRMEFDKCLDLYRREGYHFLAVTDHRKPTITKAYEDFLLLGGGEWDWNDFEQRKAVHITGIGLLDHVSPATDWNEVVAGIHRAGGIAVLAHPAWSLLHPQDLSKVTDIDAVEVWNTLSETHSGRGDSSLVLDVAAAGGWRKVMVAVDDTHFYDYDYFGGWTMVQSSELTQQSVLEAIMAGKTYATQGPRIQQIEVGSAGVRIETTPAAKIAFMTDTFFVRGRIVQDQVGLITEAWYEPSPTDTFVRIEVVDGIGKKAWSQFIPLTSG